MLDKLDLFFLFWDWLEYIICYINFGLLIIRCFGVFRYFLIFWSFDSLNFLKILCFEHWVFCQDKEEGREGEDEDLSFLFAHHFVHCHMSNFFWVTELNAELMMKKEVHVPRPVPSVPLPSPPIIPVPFSSSHSHLLSLILITWVRSEFNLILGNRDVT